MVPPENTERGSGGASNGTGAQSPPWQRVAEDVEDTGQTPDSGETSEGPTAYLPHAAGELSDSGATGSGGDVNRAESDRMTHTGDFPAVSGAAADRLFGGPAVDVDAYQSDTDGRYQHTSPGQSTVSSSSAGRPATSALRRPGRGPRRASLQIKRFDPWSVLKLSLVLGVAMFFIWLVAVGLLYTVLDGMGVWDRLNGTYTSLVAGEGADVTTEPLITAGRVFGIAAIVGMINIVLLSALATVSSFIYNVSADLAGGLEVTLSERE